jgi:electron transfer flavoprotein alpha subunit
VTHGALDCSCTGIADACNERCELQLVGTQMIILSRDFAAQGQPRPSSSPSAVVQLDVPAAARDVAFLRLIDTEPPVPDLPEATIVVAGGLGLGSREALPLVSDLAEALGGSVGGSRPIVDLGWLPAAAMIGATGRAISPELYVALGISGATQHVSSVRAKRIISVNTDPAAPMTRLADLGLVGDLHEIAPALVKAISEYRR